MTGHGYQMSNCTRMAIFAITCLLCLFPLFKFRNEAGAYAIYVVRSTRITSRLFTLAGEQGGQDNRSRYEGTLPQSSIEAFIKIPQDDLDDMLDASEYTKKIIMAFVLQTCANFESRDHTIWQNGGNDSEEKQQWVYQFFTAEDHHFGRLCEILMLDVKRNELFSESEIQFCTTLLQTTESKNVDSEEAVDFFVEEEEVASPEPDNVILFVTKFCERYKVRLDEEFVDGGQLFQFSVYDIEEKGTIVGFYDEVAFYETTGSAILGGNKRVQSRMRAWYRRLGMEGMLAVGDKIDEYRGGCKHSMGHFIIWAFCAANQCTLDLLEDDLKASRGKCHGAILHALSEKAMVHECDKMKKTAPDSIYDNLVPKLDRDDDYQLWKTLSETAINICSAPSVVKQFGEQIGECGHGLGHTMFDFGLNQMDKPHIAPWQDILEKVVMASDGCWKLFYLDHNESEVVLGRDGFEMKRAAMAYYCGTGLWHSFKNYINARSYPKAPLRVYRMIGSRNMLERCSSTAITASCFRYIFPFITQVKELEMHNVPHNDVDEKNQISSFHNATHHVKSFSSASVAVCRYLLEKKSQNKKSRRSKTEDEAMLIEKQLHMCIDYSISKALYLILDDSDEKNGVHHGTDLGVKNDDAADKTYHYTELFNEEFEYTLSTVIHAVNLLLDDEKKIDIHDPGMHPFAHIHDTCKFHPKYIHILCSRPIFTDAFTRKCLKWCRESMFGDDTDWSWGIILPNMTGAPMLPSPI